MIYFAYGSNMAAGVMAERCPDAVPVGPGNLTGFRLSFTLPSQRWGGFAADITPDDTSTTWGVLWSISECDLAALDEYEARYDRHSVRVVGVDKAIHQAMTFTVKAELRARQTGLPAPEYLRHILAGADEHGIPAAYCRQLRRYLVPNT